MDPDALRIELDIIHQRVTTLHDQATCMPECCPTIKQTLAELSADLERFGTVEEQLAARQLELLAARQAEEELKLYRLMVESVTDYAIFKLDPQGYIASWNVGAERIKGYQADEIIGQHFTRLYPLEDLERGKPAYALEVAVAQGRFEDEGWRVRKDGSRFWAIDEVLRALEPELRKRNAQVAVANIVPDVVAHPSILRQVLLNLLTNAVKFVAPDIQPQVRIWDEEQGNCMRLWIEDNGIGIAQHHQERIFGVFERLHGVESYPGSGIGLAIVRKGVERMGGHVGVESQPGTGSRFWIEFPQVEKNNGVTYSADR